MCTALTRVPSTATRSILLAETPAAADQHALAAEHAGDPERPLKGPISLQLHDIHSFVMFRNIGFSSTNSIDRGS